MKTENHLNAWVQENIHSETYSLLIDRYIQDPVEKDRVFNAVVTMPAVEEKAKWAVQWMSHWVGTRKPPTTNHYYPCR